MELTAEVRKHVRHERSRIALSNVRRHHVEFCSVCGRACDYGVNPKTPICRPCRRRTHRHAL